MGKAQKTDLVAVSKMNPKAAKSKTFLILVSLFID